jgi:hypothetical protein
MQKGRELDDQIKDNIDQVATTNQRISNLTDEYVSSSTFIPLFLLIIYLSFITFFTFFIHSPLSNEVDADNDDSLKRLDNVDNQKLANLKKWSAETHDALVWIRKNQDKFRMPIMEPPCVSMTVTDKRYADAVESCFSGQQLQVSTDFHSQSLYLDFG